jgi:hypothetical protein
VKERKWRKRKGEKGKREREEREEEGRLYMEDSLSIFSRPTPSPLLNPLFYLSLSLSHTHPLRFLGLRLRIASHLLSSRTAPNSSVAAVLGG